MDRYRCVESFEIPLCDDDGRTDENDRTTTIEKGTEWNDKGDAYVVSFRGVHLEADDYTWLEISREALNHYFEKVMEDNDG